MSRSVREHDRWQPASARPMATRCRWPPDTCIGVGRDPVAKIDRSQRDRGALAPSAVSDAGVEQPVGDVVQNRCVFDEGASVSETGALPNGPGVRQ